MFGNGQTARIFGSLFTWIPGICPVSIDKKNKLVGLILQPALKDFSLDLLRLPYAQSILDLANSQTASHFARLAQLREDIDADLQHPCDLALKRYNVIR